MRSAFTSSIIHISWCNTTPPVARCTHGLVTRINIHGGSCKVLKGLCAQNSNAIHFLLPMCWWRLWRHILHVSLPVYALSGSNDSKKLQCKNQGRVNMKDEVFISARLERSGRESDGKEIGHKICELLNTRADDDDGGMFPSLRADLQRPVADLDQVRQSKTLWTP